MGGFEKIHKKSRWEGVGWKEKNKRIRRRSAIIRREKTDIKEKSKQRGGGEREPEKV